jgi:hypothetical protein
MHHISKLIGCFCLMLAGAATAPAWAMVDDESDCEKLVKDKVDAVVTIKFVLKTKLGDFGDDESEHEITGVVVEPKGLVVCSSAQLGGSAGHLARLMGGRLSGMSATPREIKVLVGDESKEFDAELMARDSELDLAWVRVKTPGDKPFTCIDFGNAAKARLGQRLLALDRMEKFYGFAPWVAEVRVNALPKKPRELIVPSGDSLALGVPIFTPDGKVVGLTVGQMKDVDSVEEVSDLQDAMGTFVLPAAEVAKATARAKQGRTDDSDKPAEDQSKDEKQKKDA